MISRAVASAIGAALLLGTAASAVASGGGKIGLAYAAGGGARSAPKIVIANGDGSDPRTLSAGSVPAVSPNGASVAFGTESTKIGLIVYSAAGKVTGKFFVNGGVEVLPIGWSYDSRYMAVALTDVNATTQIGKSGLAIIDTTTGTATTVAHGQVQGLSWSPSTDAVVFGLIKSARPIGPSDLYTWTPSSSSMTQLTHNKHSVNPVWGKLGIAYDQFTTRKGYAPIYQIWLMNAAGHSTQITHTHPNRLVSGLAPIAVSANGQRMIAQFGGEDTDSAYTVNLTSHAVHRVNVGTQSVTPWGISRDGKRLLVDVGGFENPPGAGRVESVPFGGGTGTVLGKGDYPSWNQ